MKVLVTGGAGFVGKHLTTHLLNEGCHVTVLEHLSASVEEIADRVTVFQPDLTIGWEPIYDIVKSINPDVIIHLAAIVRAKPERQWLGPLLHTNVVLGAHLLQAAVDHGVKRFVAAGSYWQSESKSGEYDPVNLYAATKQSFSDILQYYGKTGSIDTVLLKLFGNYGPRDSRKNLFTALKSAINSPEPVAMTDGYQKIDVIHVDDVCTAFLSAAQTSSLNYHTELEVGTGETASVRQIAEWFSEGVGSSLNLGWGSLPVPGHNERAADISPTSTALDWRPAYSIETGIRSLGETSRKSFTSTKAG